MKLSLRKGRLTDGMDLCRKCWNNPLKNKNQHSPEAMASSAVQVVDARERCCYESEEAEERVQPMRESNRDSYRIEEGKFQVQF